MSFIYVGRLDELKGIKVLFEAWNMMGESAPGLMVCGMGPLEKWCKDYIKKNKLANIDMKGKIENTEVKKLIAQSDALILPTLWYEGFPMTIVEAYSVGTPVIGSNVGNVGCLIEDGVTGWKFETGSSQDLVRTVRSIKNYDLSEMHKNSFKRAFTDYSQDNNYKILSLIYSHIQRETKRVYPRH